MPPSQSMTSTQIAGVLGGALALWVPCLSGCGGGASPQRIDEQFVLREVSSRYREFFPSTELPRTAPPARTAQTPADTGGLIETAHAPMRGLLRPRLGLPAIWWPHAEAFVPIEVLEAPQAMPLRVALADRRHSVQAQRNCLDGQPVAGCVLLSATLRSQEPVQPDLMHSVYRATLPTEPPLVPGGYDLLMDRGDDDPALARRAVWLRADDPATAGALRIAHVSDLHVGKGNKRRAGTILSHVRQTLAHLGSQVPDLVLVTGDIVHNGLRADLLPVAADLIASIPAPVAVILGNHDIEFGVRRTKPIEKYGAGWAHFTQAFHPYLHYAFTFGGYEFIGFDSGPGERSLRILTRGLHPASVDLLREQIGQAHKEGRRGVVLFSHAPSRASTFVGIAPSTTGFFGRFRHGNRDFESVLQHAATQGQRIYHLAGHTHWTDVFELQAGRFQRWPFAKLSPCPTALHSNLGLITTQAAGHGGLYTKANARGWGYSMLTLRADGQALLSSYRFGTGSSTQCMNGAQALH